MEKIKNYKDSQYYSSAQQRLREVVWLGNTFGSCQVKSETRGQRENRKRGRPLQIGRWQFYNNKQQNLYTGLVLGGHKMSRSINKFSPPLPVRLYYIYVILLDSFVPFCSPYWNPLTSYITWLVKNFADNLCCTSMGTEKCIVLCIHHYSNIQNNFTTLQNHLCFIYSELPIPQIQVKHLSVYDLFSFAFYQSIV